jgi:hypothetical protein
MVKFLKFHSDPEVKSHKDVEVFLRRSLRKDFEQSVSYFLKDKTGAINFHTAHLVSIFKSALIALGKNVTKSDMVNITLVLFNDDYPSEMRYKYFEHFDYFVKELAMRISYLNPKPSAGSYFQLQDATIQASFIEKFCKLITDDLFVQKKKTRLQESFTLTHR